MISVCISMIVQMILPDGKNKKYAEVVSGLYILYVILNPILNMDSSLAISNIRDTIAEVSGGSSVSQEEVARNYILGLENALKARIEENGYEVEYIQFYITADYSAIAKIEVKMKYGTNFDESKVRELVLEDFAVGKENVIVR
ncbi:MAG: stage III sporulation protein AF [Clostridia bacterium]|nr:stage III sporulation protein AF [Clostridia bacterium]